jgi:ribosomal protein S18 acetylase RimI-like enzyme
VILDPVSVRGLEERGFNAWPALQTMVVDGWLLRFAAGHSKRANSVNPLRPGESFGAVLETAEGLYAAQGLPTIFRVTPLAPWADALLEARGYVPFEESLVMTGGLATAAPDPAVRLWPTPGPAWSAGFAAANRVGEDRRQTHDRMLAAIRLPAAFAVLEEEGQPAAYGLAVAERGMVGLFDIVTMPAARRRGLGRRLVRALLAWGAAHGAQSAYLQVIGDNLPAQALYRDLGFEVAYRYHYRKRLAQGGARRGWASNLAIPAAIAGIHQRPAAHRGSRETRISRTRCAGTD